MPAVVSAWCRRITHGILAERKGVDIRSICGTMKSSPCSPSGKFCSAQVHFVGAMRQIDAMPRRSRTRLSFAEAPMFGSVGKVMAVICVLFLVSGESLAQKGGGGGRGGGGSPGGSYRGGAPGYSGGGHSGYHPGYGYHLGYG